MLAALKHHFLTEPLDWGFIPPRVCLDGIPDIRLALDGKVSMRLSLDGISDVRSSINGKISVCTADGDDC